MGHFWASVHVGVRFKAQVHHHGDGPGLFGGCYLKNGLLDPSVMRQSPEQGGGCHCRQTFLRSIDSRVFNSWLPGPGSRLSCLFLSTQPVVRSPSRRRSPAAHRPRHSPKVDAVKPPASALPLPQLSSSRSFHHARTAAARNVVGRCRVQTVPKYSSHSPPTACAPSCPRFC